MAFYKHDGGVLEAPNFVLNERYELRAESHDQHQYPIDGWYWFDTREDAYAFFGVPLPVELPNDPMQLPQ